MTNRLAATVWILVALSSSSCRPSRDVTLLAEDLPADAWVGVLFFEAGGALAASTGLVKTENGRARLELPAPLAGGSLTALAVAYGGADLMRAGSLDPDRLRSSALAPATPTDPTLPEPRWVKTGVLEGTELALTSAGVAPKLTAAWLERCPLVLEDVALVDRTCGPMPCPARADQSGCRLTVHLVDCSLDPLAGSIDGSGAFHFPTSDRLGACSRGTPPREAAASVTCKGGLIGDCRFDLYPRSTPERFEVRSTRVFDGPHSSIGGFPHQVTGHVVGVVAFDDRILALTDSTSRTLPCLSTTPTKIVALDPETLAVLDTHDLPACTGFATREDINSFIALHESGGAAWLSRFDRFGRMSSSIPVRQPPVPGDLPPVAVALLGSGDGETAGIAFKAAELGGAPSFVEIWDLARGERVHAAEIDRPARDGTVVRDLAAFEPGGFAAIDDLSDNIYLLDPSGQLTSVFPVMTSGTVSYVAFERVVHHPDSGRLVISAAGQRAFHLFDPRGRRLDTPKIYHPPAEPYATLPWPADPSLQLVGLTSTSSGADAYVALLDVTDPHLLPGAARIGRGQVGSMTADARGRVWVTLPWTGDVARVSAKSGR